MGIQNDGKSSISKETVETILSYVESMNQRGLGKQKSLEYISKYIKAHLDNSIRVGQRLLVQKIDIDKTYFNLDFACPMCKEVLGTKNYHVIKPTHIYPNGVHEYGTKSVMSNHELPVYCPFCGQKLDINIENYVEDLQ